MLLRTYAASQIYLFSNFRQICAFVNHITRQSTNGETDYEIVWEQEIRTTINTGNKGTFFSATYNSILHVSQYAKHVIMYVSYLFLKIFLHFCSSLATHHYFHTNSWIWCVQ